MDRSSFVGPADSYDRFMGRWSRRLAPLFLGAAGIEPGMRALDVGCGPGALTEVLAAHTSPELIAAADPSAPFAAACAPRVQGADVRCTAAEALPWPDDRFDVVLAQLVVPFLTDPLQSVREMRRVAVAGGTVTACSWDYREGMDMLRVFWDAALALDPAAPDEGTRMRLATPAELRDLWLEAGLRDVTTGALDVTEQYADVDDFWLPFTAGIGPAGAYCAALAPTARAALRTECARRLGLPRAGFELRARAWTVRGLA